MTYAAYTWVSTCCMVCTGREVKDVVLVGEAEAGTQTAFKLPIFLVGLYACVCVRCTSTVSSLNQGTLPLQKFDADFH